MTTFAYTSGNPTNLTPGASASMTDIQGPFTDVASFFNSRTINEDNLPVSLLQKAALNDSSGQKGRGKSIIATTESRTNVAYGTLATPDQVTGLVLPTDGLITVGYQATWQESVAGAGRAAIFIGANQLKLGSTGTTAPSVQEASIGGNAAGGTDILLGTATIGLGSLGGGTAAGPYTGDVTTGQVLGGGQFGSGGIFAGPVYIFAAAGTYTVSIQFKSASGSVTVKNRKLWVKAEGF